MNEDRWSFHVISAYKKSPLGENWLSCPGCEYRPRVWRFDNGCYAKCCCDGIYDPAPVKAESVMSHGGRHNGDMTAYDFDDLRKRWNVWIETGVKQDTLPKGQW